MIENIRESLAQIIQQSPWMDGNSKSDALLKLSMITTKVGYFDEKPDLRRIDQFYQNVSYIEKTTHEYNIIPQPITFIQFVL